MIGGMTWEEIKEKCSTTTHPEGWLSVKTVFRSSVLRGIRIKAANNGFEWRQVENEDGSSSLHLRLPSKLKG